MAVPGGIMLRGGGVQFAPQKKMKLLGCPVPCIGGKSAGDELDKLHDAWIIAENKHGHKMDVEDLYRKHDVPASNINPSARGLYHH